MMTHTNQDEDEGADFERKVSNLALWKICLVFNCPNTYAHINEWDEL